MSGRGSDWYKPPCWCESGPWEQSEKEWAEAKHRTFFVDWMDNNPYKFIKPRDIRDSPYIKQRWGKCAKCAIIMKRRVVILAHFLARLRVLR